MARSRDEAAHAARQAAILDVAAELFAARGFHATGIAALCAAVEMSPGALYRYFRGKDEIVRALVQREADRTVARVDALKAAAHDRASLIDALVDDHPSLNIGLGDWSNESDNVTFCRRGVPYLFFWTEDPECYHLACDTEERIDYVHLVEIAALTASMVASAFCSLDESPAMRALLGKKVCR
jgi:AcrR family transcriptional regulator